MDNYFKNNECSRSIFTINCNSESERNFIIMKNMTFYNNNIINESLILFYTP